jgi:hypothetical protein
MRKGLAKTNMLTYFRCIYSISGREVTIHAVIYVNIDTYFVVLFLLVGKWLSICL